MGSISQEQDDGFSGPPEQHNFDALLFDMDGTIIDSTSAIVKTWLELGKEIGVDGNDILKTSHGRRTIDVLGLWAPHLANWDFILKMESDIPIKHGKDAIEIPGSRKLLDELEALGARWAIATSGTRGLIAGWLDTMKLAHPKYLITAEDVPNGKPDPACYRLAARKLGADKEDGQNEKSRILVLEDAPAGVRAGKAAGYEVIALATTHKISQLKDAGADWIVRDMRSVTLSSYDPATRNICVQIENALVD